MLLLLDLAYCLTCFVVATVMTFLAILNVVLAVFAVRKAWRDWRESHSPPPRVQHTTEAAAETIDHVSRDEAA